MPDNTPETDPASTGDTSAPSYTTPPVNPRDANDIGRSMRPGFSYAQNPGLDESRLHPDDTRHPTTGRITRPLQNRSK